MQGLTIKEMAIMLGLPPQTIKMRLVRAGVKPQSYAGQCGIYEENALEVARISKTPGRPAGSRNKES
jgi:hypothetical protein